MTFTIFHKTGELRDSQGDWDGDMGDEYEIEIKDKEVEKQLSRIVVDNALEMETDENEHKRIVDLMQRVISDNDLLYTLCENYADELNEWVQEEYADAE